MRLFIAVLLSLFCYRSDAQFVDIYRSGSFVSRVGTWPQLRNAVASALSGDSLVLSPHTFSDYNIHINKDLMITGTQTATDSSIIEQRSDLYSVFYVYGTAVSPTRVVMKDLIVQRASLYWRYDKIDSFLGAGIKAYPHTDLLITGNSQFRACELVIGTFPIPVIDTPTGGAAIFSFGKLTLAGNTKITDIYNGSAVHCTGSLLIRDSVVFERIAYSALVASGEVAIKGHTSFRDNYLGNSGPVIFLYRCNAAIGDSVLIANNFSVFAGSVVFAKQSKLLLSNKAVIGYNGGRGLELDNTDFTMQDSAVIGLNHVSEYKGAGILCRGSNLDIRGGQIIYNQTDSDLTTGYGVAVYADIPASTLKIANARIFNPIPAPYRYSEVWLSDSSTLESDSTWWGASDTAGLIERQGTATLTLNSRIVADWSLNKGFPIGSASTIPIDAHFRLNTGAAIPSRMFWMLAGLYRADSGKFSPDTAWMLPSNDVSTLYTAAATSGPNRLLAWVDADSFSNDLLITGTAIPNAEKPNTDRVSVYPNPSKGNVTIEGTIPITDIQVFNLSGIPVWSIRHSTARKHQLNLPRGSFMLCATLSDGREYKISVLVE